MSSPWIAGLRSVALEVPDVTFAEAFYTQVWGLEVAARCAGVVYLRGSGPDHHLLALHQSADPGAGSVARVLHVDLRARSLDALGIIADAATRAGGDLVAPVGPIVGPDGGIGVTLRDPSGRIFRVVHGDAVHQPARAAGDRPMRLAHVVLNASQVGTSQGFFEQVFGFRLTDRTRIMAFMNCNADHHSIALGDADNEALNHVAFLMPDIDAVMRGAGRMRDAGYATEWGPGRHGPGNNAFNYFVGPFDVVIEYTAEVEQIDDSYRAGRPEDWTWPPGRIDRWGISAPPTARLKQAQRAVLFASAAFPLSLHPEYR